MNPGLLHRRLASAAALCALVAFTSGAGFDAPLALPAALLLLLAIVWEPSARARRMLEPALRIAALLLAGRAAVYAVIGDVDIVAPMVDLLFLLVVVEALRGDPKTGAARLYALSFALLVAASAYRPGILFGVAFVTFIVLLTVALVVGHIARSVERQGLARRRITVPPRFVFMTAAMSAVVLLTSAAVFVTFPRVTRSWVAGNELPARSVVGFSDVVSIGEHGARIESNPEIVLRIEFPDGRPASVGGLHWRGRSYNRFDGFRWHRSELGPHGSALEGRPFGGKPVTQLVFARSLASRPIFGLHRIQDVRPRSRIWPVREANGDVSYMGAATPVYLVTSNIGRPDPATLRAALPAVPVGLSPYLQLPRLPARIARLAHSVTAGASTSYDRALRIEQYLQGEFAYTRELPRTAREASLDHFLFERRAGHCEYFSTAMVVLLRTLGIPARNVNGFVGGEWNDFGGFLAVSQNNAHSWVEVWFAGIGWVEFDPTPAASGAFASPASTGRWPGWLEGFEHRWNKWVLDYALEDQIDLLQRATEPFTGSGARTTNASPAPWRSVLVWLLALTVIVLALGLVVRGRRRAEDAEPARSYRRLRGAYASFVDAAVAPRAFSARLQRAGAPGAADAMAAVELYLRGRFGASPLAPTECRRLQQHVRAARAAVRAARGSWSRRRRNVRS